MLVQVLTIVKAASAPVPTHELQRELVVLDNAEAGSIAAAIFARVLGEILYGQERRKTGGTQ